jgi:tetraacyldisaccharide 4'-kinase
MLLKRKYPAIAMCVAENRMLAIPQLLGDMPEIQVILMDDAFQHLAVRSYLNILLTEYDAPFSRDYLLPAGNLRDWRQTYRRADIIIVTKCPLQQDKVQHQQLLSEIKPYNHQRIYFSYYDYGQLYPIFKTPESTNLIDLDMDTEVLLLCAIAKSDYLIDYLASKVKSVNTMEFEDHRLFTNYDIAQVKRLYDGMAPQKKIIVTTEKDATRLELHKDYITDNGLNMWVLPIEVNFHFEEKEAFNKDIKQALLNFKV